MKSVSPTSKKLYAFKGAVQVYEKIASSKFEATTWAVSTAKARNNIAYQFKKKMGYEPFVPVKLLGSIAAIK